MTAAAYNPLAGEYDRVVTWEHRWHTTEVISMTGALLGEGTGGLCIDVGCGTGAVSTSVARAGWRVAGVDVSHAEVAVGAFHDRLASPVVGDGRAMPYRDRVADAVISTYTHTDVPSWPAVLAEAGRVLRPGGRFVYVGMHPCFAGPHAERVAGVTVLHPGYYRDPRLRFDGPGLTPGGWREKAGTRQLTLAAFLTAFPAAGLVLDTVVESDGLAPVPSDGGDLPWLIGVRARRPLWGPGPASPVVGDPRTL